MIDYRENDTAKVEDYGLAEWLAKVQKLIQEGYVFDFHTNENYPLVFGSMYTAVMLKANTDSSALRYMEGYTAGKEWGLAQGAIKVVADDALITDYPPVVVKFTLETPETSETKVSENQIPQPEPLEETSQEQTPTKVDGRRKQK